MMSGGVGVVVGREVSGLEVRSEHMRINFALFCQEPVQGSR